MGEAGVAGREVMDAEREWKRETGVCDAAAAAADADAEAEAEEYGVGVDGGVWSWGVCGGSSCGLATVEARTRRAATSLRSWLHSCDFAAYSER